MITSCKRNAAAADARRAGKTTDWQRELGRAITSAPELLEAVGLESSAGQLPDAALRAFPLRVPRGFVSRMQRHDPADPLLRQVLPQTIEADDVPGFSADPVGDLDSMRSPGLLQKYHGRALLVTTGACAIHCRYCFRRNYPYADAAATPRHLEAALDRIGSDRTVSEVILSGGDPLSLTDEKLGAFFERIGRIDHVTRIRIHTRLPVVLPERVDTGLCDLLAGTTKPLVFVIHCNHANEIDASVSTALSRLAAHSQMLLNQSVLLRGVNDDVSTLVALSMRLFENGVMPYYLHQLDAVAGAAHFAVSDGDAQRIIDGVAARLSGYLVPKLVRERPGEASKRPIS